MSLNKFAQIKNEETGEVIAEMIAPPNALTSGDLLSEGLYALSETIIRGLSPTDERGGLGGRFGYGADFENEVFMMHHFCWCESEDCLWCGGSGCQTRHVREPHRRGCYQERLSALREQFGEREEWDSKEHWHVPYGSAKAKQYDKAKRELCRELKQDYKSGNEIHCSCGVDAEWKARYDACQCDWHLGRGAFRFGPAADAPHFWHKPSGLQVRWYKWIGRDMEVSNPNLTGAEWADTLQSCFASLPQEARDKAIAESDADAKREADPEYQREQQAAFDAMASAINTSLEACEREGHLEENGHCKRCGLVTNFEQHITAIHAD